MARLAQAKASTLKQLKILRLETSFPKPLSMAHYRLQSWLQVHLHSETAGIKLSHQACSTSQVPTVGQFSSYSLNLELI